MEKHKILLLPLWDEWVTRCSKVEELGRLPQHCPKTNPSFREGRISEVELHFIALQKLLCARFLSKIKEENIGTLFPLLMQKYSGVFSLSPSDSLFYFQMQLQM